MMAEKMLENETCQKCGAKARQNSLFCYNCGSAVSPEAVAKVAAKVGDAKKSENLKVEIGEFDKPKITNKLDEPNDKFQTLATNTNKLDAAKKPVVEKEYNLKTAAELRQEAKMGLKKSVEISWEEPENAPNIWFLAAALILTIFAVGILIAMIYIR